MVDKIDDASTTEHIQEHEVITDEEVVADVAQHLRLLTPEERVIEKKLRRKIDIRIMPLCILIYLMNYIDR